MYTNQTRITGLSGLDTESMVKQLMQAESIKYDRLYQKRQLLQWKQQAYQSVTSSLLNFQNSFLSFTTNTKNNIRSAANFAGFTTAVTVAGAASSAISVKTSATTKAGDYSIKVNQVAKADVYKSQSVIQSSLKGSSEIDFDNIKQGDSIKISLDGATAKEIVFDDNFFKSDGTTDATTFGQALDAKLNQLFGSDATGRKVQANISSDTLVITAGSGHNASISAGKRIGVFKLTGADYFVPETDIENTSFTVTIGDVTKTVNVGTIKEGTSAKDAVNQINKAIEAAFKDTGVSGVSFSLDGNKLVINNSNGSLKATIEEDGSNTFLTNLGFNVATPQTLDNTSSLAALGVSSGQNTSLNLNSKIGDLFPELAALADSSGMVSFNINGKPFEFDIKEATLNDVMKKVNTADIGVKISFNSTRSEFTLESTNTGQASAISLDPGFENGFLGKVFGFANNSASHTSVASDADIEINGLRTTRETNNFTLEGLNITLSAAAENTTFNVSVKKDSTETMNLIKNFVADYNKLIESINKKLTTARPKSGNFTYFEPLTSEQKKAMSDKEVEEWEKEAKTGMLYRDSTLSSLQSQLRGMLYQSVEMDDGTKISLFQLGITTSNKLSESGYLQIDEAKLQKMLDENPEYVTQFFTKQSDYSSLDKANRNNRLATEGFAERVNDIINWTASSPNGTLYMKAGLEGITVDSEMAKKLKEQDDKLSDMLKYLAKRETYYYNMFSRLETAMTQANSQMSALQSMLGV